MVWIWLNRVICFIIFLALLLGAGLQYVPLLNANQARRVALEQKRDELKKLKLRQSQLQSQIDALRTDPKAIERAAREWLSYARPNEVVVTFESPKVESPRFDPSSVPASPISPPASPTPAPRRRDGR